MTQTTEGTWTTPVAVEHTEVDGVPTLVAELAVDPTLTLLFGVGYSDATPATAGLTHLVEHLVMRRVGHVVVPNNAESGLRWTSFYAVGAPDQRVDFVRRVCEAICWVADEITDADLDLERQTILAEIGPHAVYACGDAFSARYGVAGVGLTAVTHTRLLDWTAAEVRETAAGWFHRGNAYLVSTAPLPDGLTLPLPDGGPVARQPHPEPLLAGRAWAEADGSQLVLSGTCSTSLDDSRRSLATAVLRDALHEALRTVSGQVYSVDPVVVQVRDTSEVWAVTTDPGEDSLCEVLVAALDVLDRLALHGPTAQELDRTRTALLHGMQLPSSRASWLDTWAAHALRGVTLPSVEEAMRATSEATAQDVRAVLAEIAASLLVTVPGGHPLDESAIARLERYSHVDLHPDPEGRTGKELARAVTVDTDRGRVVSALVGGYRYYPGRFFSPARGLRIAILPDRFVLQAPDRLRIVPFVDVVLVGTDRDGDIEIVTSRGGVLTIAPALFRGLAEPLTFALDRLPRAVRYRKHRVEKAAAISLD
jgi:predicted Zn-dependent peptidase